MRRRSRPSRRLQQTAYGFLGVLSIALLLGFWNVLATRWYPDALPTPVDAAKALGGLLETELPRSLVASLRRIGLGFAIAAFFALPLGVLIGLHAPARHFFDPIIELIRPISAIAWIPLAILWFGVTEQAAYFVITYAAVFPILINTIAGVRQVDRQYMHAAHTLGAKGSMTITEVVLPAAMPAMLDGLRVGLGIAIAVIVAAELGIGFTLGAGLGYLLLKYSILTYAPAELIAVMAVIGIVGVTTDRLLHLLQRRVMPWAARG